MSMWNMSVCGFLASFSVSLGVDGADHTAGHPEMDKMFKHTMHKAQVSFQLHSN